MQVGGRLHRGDRLVQPLGPQTILATLDELSDVRPGPVFSGIGVMSLNEDRRSARSESLAIRLSFFFKARALFAE
jgi:hypothetical protein